MNELAPLRRQLRAARRAIPAAEREHANALIQQRIGALAVFHTAQHIAAFLAFDGEVDTSTLMQQAVSLGKAVYLPVIIAPKQPLMFAPYRPGDELKPNRFDILEPTVAPSQWLAPVALDLVLTPLVGFDAEGNRLGVGGGFYDRSFAFINGRPQQRRPVLMGVAYEVQKMDRIQRRVWDVPLHGIVTEQQFYPAAAGTLLE